MAGRRGFFQSVLAVLAACTFVLANQTQKPSAPQAQKAPSTLSAQQVFKRVSPSVMVVESLDAQGKVTTLGSGVVIAPGRIITNRHVIEGGASFRVVHGVKKWPAKLIRVDADHDLAELSVIGLDAPVVAVRDSSKLAVGEKVYAIGAPEGLELTISEGLISGLRDFDNGRVIQTSAAISPGSSGGGLFDTQGRLVGITTFYLKEGQSLNFALPAEWTLALEALPAKASPRATHGSATFQALAWFEVGYTLGRAGKYAEAVNAFREATRLRPGLEGAWYNLGYAYDNLGQYDRAVSAYQEAIRLKPRDSHAWASLGSPYDHLGQYDKAINAYREAIRLEPDFQPAWYNLGIAYDNLGQYDKGVSAYREAIRLKADHEAAWVNLGAAYYGLGQYDKAISAEKEALRLKPDFELAWFNLGLAYEGLAQYDKAINAEKEALRLKPDHEGAWVNLGAAFGGVGQYDKAISAEKEALRLKPDDATAWLKLGLALKLDGQQSEAIKVYKRLRQLDPKLADKFFREVVLR